MIQFNSTHCGVPMRRVKKLANDLKARQNGINEMTK